MDFLRRLCVVDHPAAAGRDLHLQPKVSGMIRLAFIPVFIAGAALLGGCERASTDSPPAIAYGRDECAHCGMIISDDRFAAALIVRDGAQSHPLLFDDIG